MNYIVPEIIPVISHTAHNGNKFNKVNTHTPYILNIPEGNISDTNNKNGDKFTQLYANGNNTVEHKGKWVKNDPFEATLIPDNKESYFGDSIVLKDVNTGNKHFMSSHDYIESIVNNKVDFNQKTGELKGNFQYQSVKNKSRKYSKHAVIISLIAV